MKSSNFYSRMSSWSNLVSYETFVHALSGCLSSCASFTFFYPLDTVRCRLQIEDNREAKNTVRLIREIIDEEGWESLYRGLNPVLISLAASGFVYFYSFYGLRMVFSNANKPSPVNDLLIGSVAGVINIMITAPLWTLNTRIRMQNSQCESNYKGILDGLVKISKQEGVASLWSGTSSSLLLVSNPAIQFAVYEFLKQRLCKLTNRTNLPGLLILMIGATAKSISTLLTYPLQVLQTKLRNGNSDLQNMNVIQALIYQFKFYGLSGFYKGLESKLYQTVLSTALMFFCYEKLIRFISNILISYKKHI